MEKINENEVMDKNKASKAKTGIKNCGVLEIFMFNNLIIVKHTETK